MVLALGANIVTLLSPCYNIIRLDIDSADVALIFWQKNKKLYLSFSVNNQS